MPSLFPGRIVYSTTPIVDPGGKNPKQTRKLVVVSTAAEIKENDHLRVVAITSQTKGTDDEIELPYGPNCRTGLTTRSVALCTWNFQIEKSKIEVSRHFIPPTELLKIMARVR